MNINKEAHDKALDKIIGMSGLKKAAESARNKAIVLYNAGCEGRCSFTVLYEGDELINMANFISGNNPDISLSEFCEEVTRQYVNGFGICESININFTAAGFLFKVLFKIKAPQ